MKVDALCFVRAFAEVCGFGDIDTDWSRYKHATMPAFFTRYLRPVSAGFPRLTIFHRFTSTS